MKRGFTGLTLYFGILLIVLIAIVAFMGINASGKHKITLKAQALGYTLVSDQFIITYARTPVDQGVMADYLAAWHAYGREEHRIIRETSAIVARFHGRSTCWQLHLEEKILKNTNCEKPKQTETSELYIPSEQGGTLRLLLTR